ncbi:MAG TPA: DNA repair protein RadA [Candidatus Marinimicrobia bacterium]|mgnify:FL=1|jgi:DNA repair protein RadA/Sms|nr:DNA repair protein RadA [Candidatus Neomarinimicrobiota bacterium]HIN26821.1 DNA repair protein RadA [Candidatus Neomarinimicrobiota bacterium]
MAKSKVRIVFLCSSCGDEFAKWHGQCPSCSEWGTLSEYKVNTKSRARSNGRPRATTKLIDLLEKGEIKRNKTGIPEVDRVLGGGFLPGSMILLGGSPGVGKSTLALQIIPGLESNVLYVSAEESEDQLALRAKRLGIDSNMIQLSSENNAQVILDQVAHIKPQLLILDSIQNIYSENIDSIPGSPSQIRECGQLFLTLAKQNGVSVIVIGHVTKEGIIAGPKMLEHMVDTVLYLEGDSRLDHRVLRSVKNRFGTTNEVGIFQMNERGLEEVSNPSELFLAERATEVPGSAVFPALEGTRPILVEVQALVSNANFGTPQRNANGIDYKRLAMLLAVLEKRLGMVMGTKDVFVNLVGGLRISDPTADLAVIAALGSSAKDSIIPQNTVLVGEVGLAGEVRSVAKLDKRVAETEALGFKRIIVPKSSLKRFKRSSTKIKVLGVSSVREVFGYLF